jgi:small multidrug resistance pump
MGSRGPDEATQSRFTQSPLLAAAIVSEVTATLSLKGALHRPVLYLVVVLGFAIAVILLLELLRRGAPLGTVYGIWAASGVALTAVLSGVLYREPLTPLTVLGLAIVIAGVLLVELGARPDERVDGER